ncbi:MAG TPA: serine/threonine-protein kinase [Terriglobales bacterium]|jgi:hypothetical protein|nr:serine/threonine-protein kinase [Terriglobales bacterium]
MPVSTPTVLGPYEVLALVGAGGMGEVYKALDIRLNRTVALKILPKSLAQDTARLRRFEQEARILATLNHPNIVAVFDVGSDEGKPYLVTEFLSGKTLRERLREGPILARKAISYAAEIAEALSAAHGKGIVHRDLKPENIFLTTAGHVKVLDFGLARSMTFPKPVSDQSATLATVAQTEPGVVMGTVGYMAPEQVRGEAVDHRSDIFSFGAVLYEMISGKRAFHRASSVETMNAILKEAPPDISAEHPEIPVAVDRILRHCLEKEPEQRFESARDLAFDLAALSSVSDASRPQAPAAKPRHVGRTATYIAVAALMIAAAVLLGFHLRRPAATHFQRLTFQRGNVFAARFAPDRKTILYSASWSGSPPEVFSSVPETQDARPLGIRNADLLAVSRRGELAVLLTPRLQMGGFLHVGSLAQVSMSGSTAPRELADDVDAADWNADGSKLAIIHVDRAANTDRLEYPIGKVVYSCIRPDWLSHVRISPRDRLIAVLQHTGLNDDRGRVLVFDPAGNLKLKTSIWDGVYGLAWRSESKLWVTATTPRTIARQLFEVDLRGNTRILQEVPGEITLEDVASDGAALMTMNERRILIHALSEGKWRDLSLLDRSIFDTTSADSSTLLFHEGGQGGGPLGATYIRGLDGSPAVRLSEGYGVDLSADKKWVMIWLPTVPAQFRLVPTGAGDPRPVMTPDIRQARALGFARGGDNSLIWVGMSADNRPQMFATEMDGSHPHPISPAGVVFVIASQNGKFQVWLRDNHLELRDDIKNTSHPLPHIQPNDMFMLLSDDGQWAYIGRPTALSTIQVLHVNLRSGAAKLVSELSVNDLAGIVALNRLTMSPDGKTIVLCYVRHLSELYLMQAGLTN